MKLATTATEHSDGWEVEANDLGIIGCGPTREAAEHDLRETLTTLWEEFSQTQAGMLTDDALELVAKMRRAGVGDAPRTP